MRLYGPQAQLNLPQLLEAELAAAGGPVGLAGAPGRPRPQSRPPSQPRPTSSGASGGGSARRGGLAKTASDAATAAAAVAAALPAAAPLADAAPVADLVSALQQHAQQQAQAPQQQHARPLHGPPLPPPQPQQQVQQTLTLPGAVPPSTPAVSPLAALQQLVRLQQLQAFEQQQAVLRAAGQQARQHHHSQQEQTHANPPAPPLVQQQQQQQQQQQSPPLQQAQSQQAPEHAALLAQLQMAQLQMAQLQHGAAQQAPGGMPAEVPAARQSHSSAAAVAAAEQLQQLQALLPGLGGSLLPMPAAAQHGTAPRGSELAPAAAAGGPGLAGHKREAQGGEVGGWVRCWHHTSAASWHANSMRLQHRPVRCARLPCLDLIRPPCVSCAGACRVRRRRRISVTGCQARPPAGRRSHGSAGRLAHVRRRGAAGGALCRCSCHRQPRRGAARGKQSAVRWGLSPRCASSMQRSTPPFLGATRLSTTTLFPVAYHLFGS